ncbi:MAG TPA: WecB/TagA/CpsF family glycosyltransferase [Pirellulales bacterium]|nr:WecB/TagA/CpsF family glycosyltransferase [Pirellulales bacterium]
MKSPRNPRERLFGIEFDAVDMPEAVERIYNWVESGEKICRCVVTPNVDRAVLHEQHAALQQAYADAALVLADGAPLVAAARLLGRPLPCRVPGSDLAPALFEAAADRGGLRVFLLGAGPGVAERAAANIASRWSTVEVVGTYSPPLGFERDAEENESILAKIAAVKPDVLIVGFGAPKEELWIVAHRARIEAAVTLCLGATIDFLAGKQQRAPRWMRRAGLEWLHRVASEPRRLAGRYARDAWIFPQLVWRQWISDTRQTASRRASSG